jgi:hypothetical protein
MNSKITVREYMVAARELLLKSNMKKDLGVYVDKEMKFSRHIETHVNKFN